MVKARIGVLALQGAVSPHLEMLNQLGVDSLEVRNQQDLNQIDRLILPGGESSTMLRLMKHAGLSSALKDFVAKKPVWGICAGAILLAKEVRHPEQESLEAIDVRATRNFYGSQLDSFKSTIEIPKLALTIEVDFIRAPLLEPLSSQVEILAKDKQHAVLLRQGNVLVSSFHVELGEEIGLHKFFCEMK